MICSICASSISSEAIYKTDTEGPDDDNAEDGKGQRDTQAKAALKPGHGK